ncbi:WD40-repeat-containing domain protein [Linnemannia elongata]|nr:WD40-repeat-containing domain protein [Linnemannia elongata]
MTGVRFGELPHIDLSARAFSCAYSPDGEAFAVGLHDGSIEIYDTAAWTRIRSFSDPVFASDADYRERGDVIHLAFSPKGDFLVAGSERNVFGVWNYHTGELCRTLEGHPDGITSVAVSPDGRQIASAGQDKTVRLWGLHSGEQEVILTGHTEPVMTVAYSPDGKQLASGDHGGVIRLWNVQTREVEFVLTREPLGWVHSVTYSSEGRRIASGHVEGQIQIWNAETGEPGHLLVGHARSAREVAFSNNSQWIASAGWDSTVRLWDTETGILCNTLTGHSLFVLCVRFSPISPQFASCGHDRTIRIWELQDLYAITDVRPVHTFNNHACGVAFSPDGGRIALGGFSQKLWVHDATTGKLVATLKGHSEPISGVVYSPDGSLIGSSSWDNTARLWDTTTNKLAVILQRHVHWVQCLIFSTCGRWVATGSKDCSVRLWDVQSSLLSASDQNVESSGVCVSVVQPFFGPVTHLAWNPNGAMEFVSASHDHSIRAWEVVFDGESESKDNDEGQDAAAVVSVRLQWVSECNSLVGIGTKVAEAKGLTDFDRALLKQCESAKENRPVGLDEMVL